MKMRCSSNWSTATQCRAPAHGHNFTSCGPSCKVNALTIGTTSVDAACGSFPSRETPLSARLMKSYAFLQSATCSSSADWKFVMVHAFTLNAEWLAWISKRRAEKNGTCTK